MENNEAPRVNCISTLIIAMKSRVLQRISHEAVDSWELVLELWSMNIVHEEVVADQLLVQKDVWIPLCIHVCREQSRGENQSYRLLHCTHLFLFSLFVLGDWMVSDSSINIHGNMAAETDAWRLRYKRIEGEATTSGTSSE